MNANVSAAVLKDNKRQIENNFKKIRANKEKYELVDPSEKKRMKDAFTADFRSIKDIISSMEFELSSVKNEEIEVEYKLIISKFKADVKGLMDEIKELELKEKNKNVIHIGDIQLNEISNDNLNAQQAMDKGDKILNEGDDAIRRMNNKIEQTKDVSKNIKEKLIKQRDQLLNTQKNLKEIDYSLDRAGKTLKEMGKKLATDKIILGLIVIIALAIIAIIIVAAVGGDPEGKFNVPHDIFTSKKQTTNNTVITTRFLEDIY